jgi:TorA maturation chaperone TorD
MVAGPGLHDIAATRRDLYGLLSRLLLAPAAPADREKLGIPAVLETLATLYGKGAVEPWVRAASRGEAAADIQRRERQDFMDLFATPSASFVKPWESVYRDERRAEDGTRMRGLLRGPSTVAVERAYEEAGAQFDPRGLADLPDNAGVELAFLGHLCERERAAAEDGREAEADAALDRERRFVEEHAARWLPLLGDEIAARAETDFYRGLGAFLRAFIVAEEMLLRSAAPARGGDPMPDPGR